MLTEVADGVWVRQSAWVWTNSIVVRDGGGLILVDPGIDGSELNELADDLGRLEEAARHVGVIVPGHGAVAEGPEIAVRLAADHAYIGALRRGEDPVDARLGPGADWLSGPHQANLEQARRR